LSHGMIQDDYGISGYLVHAICLDGCL
jgi:hypothetical protein